MNRALIQLIEHELVQVSEATNEQQFEKHMYAIHTLTSIYANNESKDVIKITRSGFHKYCGYVIFKSKSKVQTYHRYKVNPK